MKTTTKEKIPDELRRLADLTLLSKFRAMDEKIRAEADEKDRKNREKIEALLVRLVPIDRDLRAKIDVQAAREAEYRVFEAELEKARARIGESETEGLAAVKAGRKTYDAHLAEKGEARAAFEAAAKAIEEKRAPLLKMIRDLDDEIKQLQILWLEIELEIRTLASVARLEYFHAIGRQVKEFQSIGIGFNVGGLRQNIKERHRQSGNYRKGGNISPLTITTKAGRAASRLIFDSRIADKNLPKVKGILEEVKRLDPGQEIVVNITPDIDGGGDVKWAVQK